MRKIIVSEMISLDGFFAGKDGNINWHVVEKDFNEAATKLLNEVDTILFGRITYDLFESYWPAAEKDPKTFEDDLVIAKKINEMKKIVFSKSLKQVGWNNVELKPEITVAEIESLKRGPGKDIVVYGSGTIVQKLTELGLVDEYRLFVAPVFLGEGKLLLNHLNNNLKLKLTNNTAFSSGVEALRYVPL